MQDILDAYGALESSPNFWQLRLHIPARAQAAVDSLHSGIESALSHALALVPHQQIHSKEHLNLLQKAIHSQYPNIRAIAVKYSGTSDEDSAKIALEQMFKTKKDAEEALKSGLIGTGKGCPPDGARP